MYIFQPSQARVVVWVSGMGSATSLGPSGSAWTCCAWPEAWQPQRLHVTLIFSAGAASAWMTALVGYVGWGL